MSAHSKYRPAEAPGELPSNIVTCNQPQDAAFVHTQLCAILISVDEVDGLI